MYVYNLPELIELVWKDVYQSEMSLAAPSESY